MAWVSSRWSVSLKQPAPSPPPKPQFVSTPPPPATLRPGDQVLHTYPTQRKYEERRFGEENTKRSILAKKIRKEAFCGAKDLEATAGGGERWTKTTTMRRRIGCTHNASFTTSRCTCVCVVCVTLRNSGKGSDLPLPPPAPRRAFNHMYTYRARVCVCVCFFLRKNRYIANQKWNLTHIIEAGGTL